MEKATDKDHLGIEEELYLPENLRLMQTTLRQGIGGIEGECAVSLDGTIVHISETQR